MHVIISVDVLLVSVEVVCGCFGCLREVPGVVRDLVRDCLIVGGIDVTMRR